MSDIPVVRYAKSGDVHIGYQLFGEGERDLLFLWAPWSNIDLAWENPAFASFLRRLGALGRVIQFDRRGTGLSDRAVPLPTLEEQMDDVLAVLDAARSERAILIGGGDGSFMCTLFAATHPERTSALVLMEPHVRIIGDAEIPGPTPAEWEDMLQYLAGEWGTGITAAAASPDEYGTEEGRRWWGRLERQSVSPGSMLAIWRMLAQVDVRPVLPAIHVPTLVLHRTGDAVAPVEHGRYIASKIPGAKFIEEPGNDHAGWGGDPGGTADEIEEFITGHRPARELDRVLATVLFTDIVGSTERARELGDRKWRDVLDRHDSLTRREVEQFGGRLVKSTGDGALATFDGPARAIRCATVLRQELPVPIRAGLHTGEVELRGGDVGGIAVHIGARVAALARAHEVLVSRTVKDLVAGSGIEFVDRGVHTLKGVPDEWQLYAVLG